MNIKEITLALAITTWMANAQVPRHMNPPDTKDVGLVSAVFVQRVNKCLDWSWRVWPNCFVDLGVSIWEEERLWLNSQWLSAIDVQINKKFVHLITNTENRKWSPESTPSNNPSNALPSHYTNNLPSCTSISSLWWVVQSDPNTGSMINGIRCR